MLENELQRAIRLALGREPDLVLWRNSVGLTEHPDGRVVRYGLAKGSSDLVGVGPQGRFVALEVKRPGEKPTPDQSLFLALVEKRGGFAAVVHSMEEAREAIERCRGGNDLS